MEWSDRSRPRGQLIALTASPAWFYWQIGGLLSLCLLLRQTIFAVLRLQPEDVYRKFSFVLGALWDPIVFPIVVGALLVGFFGREKLRWRNLDEDGLLRVPLTLIVVVLGWYYSTYAYNGFHGQTHALDRLLLVALAIGAVLHAAALPRFFVVLSLAIGQFHEPLYYSLTDISLLMHVLLSAIVFMVMRLVVPMDARALVFTWLVIVGASYFDAAWRKWAISPHGYEWMAHNDIANLFVASHLNGWLPELTKEDTLCWAARIHDFAIPIQVTTFAIEVLPLFMLLSRRLTIGLIFVFVAMHLGIFAASGIDFWKWSLLDLAFAFVLWRKRDALWFSDRRRTLALAALAFPLVMVGGRLGFGSSLGWFDTRLTQWHSFTAFTDDGGEYQLGERDFAPYDKAFAQDRFFFLHGNKQLVTTLGATNIYPRFLLLQDVEAPAALFPLYEEIPRRRRNDEATAELDELVVKLMQARNRGAGQNLWPARLAGPMHISHGVPSAAHIPDDVIVTMVRVHFHEALYTGDDILPVSDAVVHEVVIP